MDGIAAELLFDTPAIDQAHDFCFSFINDEMLWGSQGFPDIRVSRGRIAPVDAPLAGSKQAPTSGALLNQRAFVLGEHALHLYQHLFFWTAPQRRLDKDDLTATAAAFLDQEDLIGIAPRQTIRHGNEEDRKGAFRHEITQTVKRWAIQARPADAFINKDACGNNVIAHRRCRFREQVDLAGDGLFAFLFFGRDAGIQRHAGQARCAARRRGRRRSEERFEGTGAGTGWGDGGGGRSSSIACHKRSFPSRHGTWIQTIASAGEGFGDAIRCPPG